MSGIAPDDPDFLYLGVDRKKVIQEAPAYDGKKNCWIPDVKDGYLAAEIESTKGDVVTVMTTEKRMVSSSRFCVRQVFVFVQCLSLIANEQPI